MKKSGKNTSRGISMVFLAVSLSLEGWAALPAESDAKSKEPAQPPAGERCALAPGVDETYIREGWDCPFGVDYIFVLSPEFRDPKLARDFGGVVKVRWVNFARVGWGALEPNPPKGGRHTYDWSGLDNGVRQWQSYGVHILVTLGGGHSRSQWGTRKPTGEENVYLKGLTSVLTRVNADYLPKPEHVQDYRDYITALVERYDGDGVDDMPGLCFPILHYQAGNEYCNELFWGGTVEDYGVFLKMTAEAARKANPNVKIVLSGSNTEHVYGFYSREMDPRTRAYVEKNLPRVSANMRAFGRRNEQFDGKAMQFCSDYDILDARNPFNGYIQVFRERLQQFGCPKEIWAAESYVVFPLLPESPIAPNITLVPYPTPSKSSEYIDITKRPDHKRFPEVNGWYRGLQAAYLVKSIMAALDAGAKKLMEGYAIDVQEAWSAFPGAIMGLRSKTSDKLWPCAYTYKVLIEKLDGFRSCARLPMPETAYVYECFVKGDRKVLVAFCDDHIAQNMEEPLGKIRVDIPLPAKDAVITHIITEMDKTQPVVEKKPVQGGKLRLELTEYPVFIETSAN